MHGEPVTAAHRPQVVVQLLINQCTLGLQINFPGLGEAISGIGALLGNPEGMFKTDENGCSWSGKELKIRVGLIRPIKECKEGAYVIENI